MRGEGERRQCAEEENEREAMRGRAVAFWTWHLGNSTDADIRGFGGWMLANDFDPAWRLKQLSVVLYRARSVDMYYQIVEVLGRLAEAFPAETLKCIRLLIGQSMEDLRLRGLTYRGDLQRIIRCALKSDDPALRQDATALANELVARGFRQFRDVLNPDFEVPEDCVDSG